jgi:hypothetical protein
MFRLISCSHRPLQGGVEALVGRHGAMKRDGSVRMEAFAHSDSTRPAFAGGVGLDKRTSGLPAGGRTPAEPFGQPRALCLIGPRGGVSEPGEEDRRSTRDPAKPHRDHQSCEQR